LACNYQEKSVAFEPEPLPGGSIITKTDSQSVNTVLPDLTSEGDLDSELIETAIAICWPSEQCTPVRRAPIYSLQLMQYIYFYFVQCTKSMNTLIKPGMGAA
jgi:hypothetical protein